MRHITHRVVIDLTKLEFSFKCLIPGATNYMFSRLFNKDPQKALASKHYDHLVEVARRPFLYGEYGANDSVDGRFEMIVLHAVILMRRLREGDEAAVAMAQLVFDHMFDDMDAALREMGTGDLSVGKKIREMGEVFYGRAETYTQALKAEDEDSLADAIARNLELEDEGDTGRDLARYALRADAALQAQHPEALARGEKADFPSM